MGNKRRMSIRAERPHVGTDPVSVRLSANSIYRPHNVFRPVVSGCGQTRGSVPTCGLIARIGACHYYESFSSSWHIKFCFKLAEKSEYYYKRFLYLRIIPQVVLSIILYLRKIPQLIKK